MKRCNWCAEDPLYIKYHDEDWGVPVYDDGKLFEMLILEGMQAGLSWITILRRRENFYNTFDKFDPKKIAKYDDNKLNQILQNPGIIRNRLKVFAVRQNAVAFLNTQKEFSGFKHYLWSFVNEKPQHNAWKNFKDIPTTTEISDALSKDLKKRGFSFVGSTICYAYMQAVGLVNDHLMTCFRYKQLRTKSSLDAAKRNPGR
ncbi:MAG: DNA-3-methyladenine glycosylase I [Gammaproteobacteria bacterium]|nr:DNA-3-methyladenine glycosylase I [Gammaproteobacteria bacterium]